MELFNNPSVAMIDVPALCVATWIRRILLAASALVAVAATAGAQTPPEAQANAVGSACRADYQTHCAAATPGSPESLSCLQQNTASLSADCRRAVARMPTDAQRSALRSSCRSDYISHCRSTTPGSSAALSCLRDNLSTLSASCKSAVGAIDGG